MPSAVFFSSRSAIQIPDWCCVRHQHWTDLGTCLWQRRNYKLRTSVHRPQFGYQGKNFSVSFWISLPFALKGVIISLLSHIWFLYNHFIPDLSTIFPSTDDENICAHIFLCSGRSPPQYRVPLLPGSHLQQRHWSLHQRRITEDLASQYVAISQSYLLFSLWVS